ncbi:MAG: hypothetical protein KBT45_00005, partial [Bacteroidales bacterium]|nr:hypothetical protein [Candidatus Colimorpha pelethequi]
MPRPITYFSLSFSRPNFTGKETDCETGYSYFGARYYDPTLLTSFLSIDRYADKYPSLSPYHYCAWNPMVVVDPNGDTIVYTSEADRAYVMSLTQKKINGKKNPNYSKAFAEKISDLE